MTVEVALQSLRVDPRDGAAWEIIVLEVYRPLLAYVASLLLTFRIATGETAHDIVHDVLLSFYERWPKSHATIDSTPALHGYLRRSCRNLLVDRYRHQQHSEQFVDFLTMRFKNAFQETDLYRSIFLSQIIEKLSPDCASLLRRFVVEDLSPAEIAEETGAPAGTFYSKWRRCIQSAKNLFLQNVKKNPVVKR